MSFLERARKPEYLYTCKVIVTYHKTTRHFPVSDFPVSDDSESKSFLANDSTELDTQLKLATILILVASKPITANRKVVCYNYCFREFSS